jgi:hypothetical protein
MEGKKGLIIHPWRIGSFNRLIAAGNQVVKNAQVLNQISKKQNMLC